MSEIEWRYSLKYNLRKIRIFEFIFDSFYGIKLAYQRAFKNYDDRMIGDIDFYLMKIIPSLITELRKQKPGLSSDLFYGLEMDDHDGYSEEDEKIAQERYDVILDKIIEGFKAYEEMNYGRGYNNQELKDKFDEGFELLHKWFHTLNN